MAVADFSQVSGKSADTWTSKMKLSASSLSLASTAFSDEGSPRSLRSRADSFESLSAEVRSWSEENSGELSDSSSHSSELAFKIRRGAKERCSLPEVSPSEESSDSETEPAFVVRRGAKERCLPPFASVAAESSDSSSADPAFEVRKFAKERCSPPLSESAFKVRRGAKERSTLPFAPHASSIEHAFRIRSFAKEAPWKASGADDDAFRIRSFAKEIPSKASGADLWFASCSCARQVLASDLSYDGDSEIDESLSSSEDELVIDDLKQWSASNLFFQHEFAPSPRSIVGRESVGYVSDDELDGI